MLLRLDGVSNDIDRSEVIEELPDEEKNKTFRLFLEISQTLAESYHYPLCMMDCIKALHLILYDYQENAKVYGLDYTMQYSLQDYLGAERKYSSDFEVAVHPLGQPPPPPRLKV